MHILITNIVVLNGGDGAILFGMLKALRRAFGEDCEFVVFASEPAVASRMYPEIQFRKTLGLAATRAPARRYIGRLVRTFRSALYLTAAWCWGRHLRFVSRLLLSKEAAQDMETYANADLVVSSGGTYLKEEYGMVSQICDYRITMLLQRPLAFFTQTLGPFTSPNLKYRCGPSSILPAAFCCATSEVARTFWKLEWKMREFILLLTPPLRWQTRRCSNRRSIAHFQQTDLYASLFRFGIGRTSSVPALPRAWIGIFEQWRQ